MRRGFSLLESLISLTVFCIVILAGFESFGTARYVFFKLRDAQESRMAALAALERIRADILQAGLGLDAPLRLGLVEGIIADGDAGVFVSAETSVSISAGQAAVFAPNLVDFAAGRSVCVCAGAKGETAVIQGADGAGVTLSSPLAFDYPAGETRLILLRRVSIYLDAKTAVLRRKINASSAQPLLEGTASFAFEFERASSLAAVRFRLEIDREKIHEISAVAKNLALANKKSPF